MSRSERTILLLLAAAQFILTLDTTVMNVSISTLVVDLHTTVSGIQSAITFYTLVMAAFMIAGAKVGDIIGRKKAFIIGLIIYGIGSLITGLSVNVTMLKFGWSLLEGLGAALVIPAMLALISGNFKDGASRAKAFGGVAAMAAIGAAAGPIIGGLLTTYATWRLAFLGEVVVVAIILLRQSVIKDVPFEGKRPDFDYLGMFLCAAGLASLVQGILFISSYGLVKARTSGSWFGHVFQAGGLSPAIMLILLGLLILGVFTLFELWSFREKKPTLVDLKLLGRVAVRGGTLTVMSQQFIIAALMYTLSLYLQMELGYSAFRTGVALLPLSLAILLLAASAARLASRFTPKSIIVVGYVLMVVSMAAIGFKFVINPTATNFAVILFIMGAGIGLVVSQLQNLVLSSVSSDQASETSGLLSTFQNLGASLGTAIAGAAMIAVLISVATGLVSQSASFTSSQQAHINSQITEQAAIVSNQAFEAGSDHLPSSDQAALSSINSQARQDALSYSFIIIAILGLFGLFAALSLPKAKAKAKLAT